MNNNIKNMIDELFAKYDRPAPGCAYGIVQNGELVHSGGYGIANLEYDIPITPKTVFHVASVSKQFTSMAIALLEEKGLIKQEDDIREYFPKLPQYPWAITVRDLIYMTNGLYDFYGLAGFIVGIRENDFFTKEQAWQYIKACDWLMFEPGTKWSYGNTGYFLLAELVERVTGEGLSEFAHKNIFQPLGMDSSFFRDDRAKIIKNRAESYSDINHIHYNEKIPYTTRNDKVVVNADLVDFAGAGQLWTSIEDLARWENNFYDNKLGKGSMDLIKNVMTPGKLKDGSPVNYAYGQFIGTKDGLNYVSHGGFSHGNSSFIHRVPEKKLTVITLANHTDIFWDLEVYPGSYSMAEKVMELVLDDFQVKPYAKPPQEEDGELNPIFSPILGRYQDPLDSWLLTIKKQGDKCVADLDYGRVLELVPETLNRFRAFKGEIFTLEDTKIIMQDGNRKRVFHRFLPDLTPQELEEYAGEYTCERIDATFIVTVEGGKLTTKNKDRRYTAVDFKWQPTIRDTFLAEYPPYCPFYCITFIRDAKGEIISMVYRDDEGSGRENIVFKREKRAVSFY